MSGLTLIYSLMRTFLTFLPLKHILYLWQLLLGRNVSVTPQDALPYPRLLSGSLGPESS